MTEPHPSGSLTRLAPSPTPSSTSSLTSDEETFNPHAPPPVPNRPRVLGVRELVEMAKKRGTSTSPTAPVHSQAIKVLGLDDLGMANPDLPPSYATSSLYTDSETRAGAAVFARDVRIGGWKIVGGKSWTDKAKVGAYVVYEIEISLWTGGSINILRRYTDFVNLRQSLKKAFPHLDETIPQLPGKAHMAKFDPKFLAERQPRLQRFLRTVMLHPEMGKAGEGSVIGAWVTDRRPSAT